MAKVETVTETWLYAGKRLDAKGKLMDAWHDGGELCYFGKLSGGMPGHAYAVDVTRKRGEDGVRVSGIPRYLAEQSDRVATPKQLDEWRAEHRAAQAVLEGKRAEKQAAEDDDLERALEVLRRHYARLSTQMKRGAFQSYVLGEVTRKPKQERQS